MNDFDRIPPQCVGIEKGILAAFFTDQKLFSGNAIKIKPEYFYLTWHRQVFEKMLDLNVTDFRIICESIPGKEVELAEILEAYAGNINMEFEIAILRDRYERRSIIAASTEAIEKSFTDYDTPPLEILQNTIAKISGCQDYFNPPESVAEILPRVFDKIKKSQQGSGGLKTGISDLDAKLGGFENDEYIIIAGRPSMGKTALALQIARYNAITCHIPVLIFSIETGKTTLTARMLFSWAKISYDEGMSGLIDDISGCYPLQESNIYIDDTAAITINHLEAVSDTYIKNNHIGLVIIDHIGLINIERGRSRNEELSEISRRIKACYKKNKVPVIAVCQLSRDVEHRKPPIPMLSDLRDSGSLEQDADKVIFIYRDEYYTRTASDKKGVAEIILAKNKNGKTGLIEIHCDLKTMSFDNLRFENQYQDDR